MTFVPAAGFADPVMDANTVFRAVLNALAHPGRLFTLPAGNQAPAALGGDIGAILLALADRDTPVWLADADGGEEIAQWLAFHTGATLVREPGQAAFAVGLGVGELAPLDAYSLGSAEYPDRSTTLIVGVESLREGEGLTLSGPGIQTRARLAVGGVPADYWLARAELAPLYPLGIDMIFCASGHVAALPRTTAVEV